MAPVNTDTKKTVATHTLSSAQRGVANTSKRTRRVTSGNTDEGDTQDRISNLPHAILGCILTLLSVREAAQTMVLSRAWKGLFWSPEHKLDSIDDNNLGQQGRRQARKRESVDSNQSQWRSTVITSLLNEDKFPIRRFVVQRTLLSDNVVSGWFDKLSQKRVVQEIILDAPLPYPIMLPHSIFRCTSLQMLSLSNVRWPRINPSDVPASNLLEWTLPSLTELTLSYMDMTLETTKDLLVRCTALLSLSLCFVSHNGRRLDIRSKTLLSLTVLGSWESQVHIMDTPKLERLLRWPWVPFLITFEGTIQERAPRLHTLGIFPVHTVTLPMLGQVTTIALYTKVDNFVKLRMTMLLLHKFPQLETLHIEIVTEPGISKGKPINFEETTGGPVACLENSVKIIVLRVNNLVHEKLAFTNFLLGAAKALKSMLIYKNRMTGELLRPESRGSSDAQIVLCDSNQCSLDLDTSASNINLADPFML